MKKSERAQLILSRLQELYPSPPIPLDHRDPFTLLIAVLLSAQCTDVRVNQVTPELFRLADTPEAMADVPVEEIQAIIRPCGLSPRKSKAISELSRILVEQYDSAVPPDLKPSKACLVLVTRPPASSWPKPSTCRRFPSTRIFIVWPSDGD